MTEYRVIHNVRTDKWAIQRRLKWGGWTHRIYEYGGDRIFDSRNDAEAQIRDWLAQERYRVEMADPDNWKPV